MEYLICLREQNSKIVGCTSISVSSDLKEIQVKNLPLQTKKLDNATIGMKGIKSTNGAISRYPVISGDKVKNPNSFILLGYYGNESDKTYVYCDYKGTIYKENLKELRMKMFANAKIVNKGITYLAFISGECPKLNYTETVKEVVNNTPVNNTVTNENIDVKEVLQKAKPKNSRFLIETGNIQEFLSTYMENLREFVKDPNTLSKLGEKLTSLTFNPIKIQAPAISQELKNKNYGLSMLGVAA